MKKLLSVLLVVVLLLCVVSALAEVSGPLVLYSSMTDIDIENLIEAFNEKYPDVEVEVVTGSPGELEARARAEKGNPQGDLQWGGLSPSDGSANDDIFALYTSPYEDDLPDDYKSDNRRYNYDHLSAVVFCVNIEMENELGFIIRTYEDLLRPELKGRIILSDPNSSTAGWNNLCNIFAVYGYDSEEAWTVIRGLISNGTIITTSGSQCYKTVNSGENVVGLTYENMVLPFLKTNADRIRLQYPENGVSANLIGCAMISGCPHPEAAKAMIDFLMSPEGQEAVATRLGTLRFTNPNAVYYIPNLPANDTINWVSRDSAWLTDHKAGLLAKWNALISETQAPIIEYHWADDYHVLTGTIYDSNGTIIKSETIEDINKTITEPTCEEKGYITYQSGEFEYPEFRPQSIIVENADALGHTEVIDEAVPPTCIEVGKTEGSHCSVCGKILVEPEEIPMIEHQYELDQNTEATCTEPALSAGFHCPMCGKVFVEQQVTAPPLGHDWGDWLQYAWSEENWAVVYAYVCRRDETHLNVQRTLHTLVLPDQTVSIGEEAFADLRSAQAVFIPASVSVIAADAFNHTGVIIAAPAGSYALGWAEANGFDHIAVKQSLHDDQLISE